MQWKENSKQYENPPAGSHLGRLVGLVDLGTQRHVFGEDVNLSRDVRLTFELSNEKMQGVYDEKDRGKPFGVSRTVKQSLHAKATLRKLLEGWRGKKFSKEDIEKFDEKKLLGVAARLTLIENGEYVNLESIAPVGKTEKVPKQINPTVYFSLDNFDEAVFNKLGKATQEKIAKSPEYAALKRSNSSHDDSDNPGSEVVGEGEPSDSSEDEPF